MKCMPRTMSLQIFGGVPAHCTTSRRPSREGMKGRPVGKVSTAGLPLARSATATLSQGPRVEMGCLRELAM
jgi:hypothetical protein